MPNQIDTDPIAVKERIIRQFDCPNPKCDESLDITNVNVGTKIQCGKCQNVTWLPDYGKKWWQKPASIIGGLILSFAVGVAASLTANWLGTEEKQDSTSQQSPSNNKMQPTAKSGG
jgi:hypothetical protein